MERANNVTSFRAFIDEFYEVFNTISTEGLSP